MFTDTDSIIAEITSEAQKQIDSNRDDANRMRSELAASTKLTDGLAGLLLDPEMARETFDAVGSPEKLHAFMERFAGPSVSHPDGRLLAMPANKDGSGDSGAGLNGDIAATGVEPVTLGL